jgi:sugar transferase (PEP-CTERM/EpsH1 system associated)
VHTRNRAALEATVPAWAAGVPVRIHGEHGRDIDDLQGTSRRHRWLRRIYSPFVTRYIAVSRDLESYLTEAIGVAPERVSQVYNGVDAVRFHPRMGARPQIQGCPFVEDGLWIVGHIGRLEAVKDQLTLIDAFVRALKIEPGLRSTLRLVIVGDGSLRSKAQAMLQDAGVAQLSWMPGERADVPLLLRSFDCFVLPSRGEGISNTVLESMASGLPVLATDVGGNRELIEPGRTGELLPPGDAAVLAEKIVDYAREPKKARAAGRAGRARVEQCFSLAAMVGRYQALYDSHFRRSTGRIQRVRTA